MNANGKKEEIHLNLINIGCWEIYLGPGGQKFQGTGWDWTLRTFVIRTVWQCYSGNYIKKNKCVGMWRERVQAYTGFGGETWEKEPIEMPRYWWGNNIKRICKIWLVFEQGWSFFGRKLGSCCCEKPLWIIGLHEMFGIAWLTDVLFACQEGFCIVDLVVMSKLTDNFTWLTFD